MSSDLTKALLDKPVGPDAPPREIKGELTQQIEVSGDSAAVVLPGTENEEGAADVLKANGLDPQLWVATGFRTSEWTHGTSTRYTFARAGSKAAQSVLADGPRPPIDELFAAIKRHRPKANRPDGDHGFIVALGDMQFGKIDGDGVDGTLARTIDCLDKAADRLAAYRRLYDFGHVHLAWLGDHIEGFVSQGGANTWRTQLTLNEQIRLTRRVMLHALTTFTPLVERLSMAAVPGNHGESVRFMGKGVTRYDDSHDTESLIAVADAAALAADAYGHVEFYVPQTDELTVVLDVAGTRVAHAHGHQWRPGKHMEWWQGQAFNRTSAMHDAHLLLAGHLHHEFIDTDSDRTFIQPPAMESESTWFRHSRGTTGAPGLIVAVTKDGQTNLKEVIR